MHENRDTSVVPANSAGRSGKANSHEPDMHAVEESDRDEVPMNQANNEVQTTTNRMRAKLAELKQALRSRMHESVPETGKWLQRVVKGYYQYHAVPGNIRPLSLFRVHLCRLWRHVLRRRSQTAKVSWDVVGRIVDLWIPAPRILHPYPDARFDARIRARSRMR